MHLFNEPFRGPAGPREGPPRSKENEAKEKSKGSPSNALRFNRAPPLMK